MKKRGHSKNKPKARAEKVKIGKKEHRILPEHHKKLKKGWFAERGEHKLAAQGIKPREKELSKYKIIYLVLFIISTTLAVFSYLSADFLSFGIALATAILSIIAYIMIIMMKKKIEFFGYVLIWTAALIFSVLSILNKNFLSMGILVIVMIAISILSIFFVKKTAKDRIIHAVRAFTREKKGTETDIDSLYALLKELKKIKISEIAMAFSIDLKKAEDWCKILEEHELASFYYPPFGEAELRWREK